MKTANTIMLFALLCVSCATADKPPKTLSDEITESLLLESDCRTGRKPAAECPPGSTPTKAQP